MKEYFSSETKLALAKRFIEHTPIAYIILDSGYNIHYINESFAALRKLDRAAVLGDKCYNISNGGMPCHNCAVAETLHTGAPATVSRKDTLPDGTVRYLDDYAIPLRRGPDGRVEFVLELMINRTREMLAREQRNRDYDRVLSLLTSLIGAKDTYTATHSENVRRLSLNLARTLGLPPDTVFEISVAASLHDIGKIYIPDAIINKPGHLTPEEFAQVKGHATASGDILERFTSFQLIRDVVRHHHERVDGGGYPDGLAGAEISLGAKIVAVADTYDAITTTRSYRSALPHAYALEELRRVAGTQLDPQVVEAFAAMDFTALTEELYEGAGPRATDPVERQIQQRAPDRNRITPTLCADQDSLFDEMFQNTPCRYVLLDGTCRVLYASARFLEYLALREETALGALCPRRGGAACADCPVSGALRSGQTETARLGRGSGDRHQSFDLFAVPLTDPDSGERHVMGALIDRTAEDLVQTARQKDFQSVIALLTEIFDCHQSEIDTGTPHMADLRRRFEALRTRQQI